MKKKKQGYNWLFKTVFTLPGLYSTVEGDKVYFIMKSSPTVTDALATINISASLTDTGNLSGTTVTTWIKVPKATTKLVTPGMYVAEFYWEVAGNPTEPYPIGDTQNITVVDAVKDVPS